MRKNIAQAAIAFSLLIFLTLACGGGKPVAPKYQGHWEMLWDKQPLPDLYLEMNADGTAGFSIAGKEVNGGGAVIDEKAKTITISLMGVSHTWKIIAEPNENGEMTLSDTTDLSPLGKMEGKAVYRKK